MSFSFRSMFPGTSDPGQAGDQAPRDQTSHANTGALSSPFTMSPATAPPLNSTSPFGTPLFKIAPGENHAAQPVQQSPFSVTPSAGTGSPLTVADVLPQLPPEIARAGALPMDQPVAISPQVLEEALRGGQAALPIFEVYRVCPALFQTPISPQDPRMIPLPASKLPRLIAATQPGVMPQNMGMGGTPGATPFGMSHAAPAPTPQPPAMMAETQMSGQPSPSGMMLPPKRQGPPPPLADIPGRDASLPQLSLPAQPPLGAMPVFPTSPFSASTANGSAVQSPSNPMASPFGAMPGAEAATMTQPAGGSFSTSPFASAAPAPSAAPGPAPALSSPFASAAVGSGQQPGLESPFGALFGNKAVPTGQPAPDGGVPRAVTMPGFPASQPATSSAQVRLPFATLLRGYTAAELGFDPMVVPGWITLSLPAQKVQELASTSAPVCELGILVDGITDVGFRNVLNTAKRDFQLRLQVEEMQKALSSGAPPSLPNLASLGFPQPAAAAPAMAGMMRVEPPAPAQGIGPSPFAPAVPLESSGMPGPNSPFLAPAAAPSPVFAPAASAPTFAPASAAEPPKPSLFTPAASQFAPAQPFPASTAGTSMFSTPAPAAMMAPQSQPLPQTAPAAAHFQPQPAPANPPPTVAFQPAGTGSMPPSATFQPVAMAAALPTFQPAPAVTKAQDPFVAFKPAAFEPKPAPFSMPTEAPAPTPVPEVPVYQTPQGMIPSQPDIPAPAPTPEPAYIPPVAEMTVLPPEKNQEYTAPAGAYSFAPPVADEGFNSDQLLGREVSPPRQTEPAQVAATAEADLNQGSFQMPQKMQTPASFFDVEDEPPAPEPPPVRAFVPPAYNDGWDEAPATRPQPKPQPKPQATEAKTSRPAQATRSTSSPNLGVQMHDTDPDQILLRALLSTDSDLTPQKVVEMTCALPGIAACVCIHGQRSFSHIGAHKPQARDFQRQATDLAQHLKTLAPLIGIEGAETFTMNSGDRLMTFCFPDGAILGVLHDAEPTLGLRDKITLIARELSRMIA